MVHLDTIRNKKFPLKYIFDSEEKTSRIFNFIFVIYSGLLSRSKASGTFKKILYAV